MTWASGLGTPRPAQKILMSFAKMPMMASIVVYLSGSQKVLSRRAIYRL
jgi:hypothetical protein